jgi:hypothetical protein
MMIAKPQYRIPLTTQLIVLENHTEKLKIIADEPALSMEYKVIVLNTIDDLIRAKSVVRGRIEEIKNTFSLN